ncbi:MAG TPA: D-alanyl-D-alanine carboxypeptidase/D-alanyl-D-alanine-endopeptidase, partial [Flavisolibacter sp.]|nr:D-alanyl-D-alanine carboxypeptidase/D-alanyl-D-alanine-endopeptidase [Flavisolibacter sp.]
MKKVCLLCGIVMIAVAKVHAQSTAEKLKATVILLEKDPQLRHGILGFYVADAKTGKAVFDKNSDIGLAPASTQKIITSAAAFELLGRGYQFKTRIGCDTNITDEKLAGNLYITGSGDPTFGSWRWSSTTEQAILNRIVDILKRKSIRQIAGNVMVDDISFTFQPVPDGWIWQDLGNYYGAGAWSLNWRENQYDLVLQSDKNVGGSTSVVKTIPSLFNFSLANFITAGKKGSGDNGYIYTSPFASSGFTTGTIPADEKAFVISGSMPQPAWQFLQSLQQKFKERNILVTGQFILYSQLAMNGQPVGKVARNLDSISSPILDSVNFWFMRKSINLYGEAFAKA